MESDAFLSVKIGSLTWAAEDLRVSTFRNGDPIPLVKWKVKWFKMESAAYTLTPEGYYLYNWFAVNDPRGLAPVGWHVSTDEEWEDLKDFLVEMHGGHVPLEVLLSDVAVWEGMTESEVASLPAGYQDFISKFYNYQGVRFWRSASGNGENFWYCDPHPGISKVRQLDDSCRQEGFAVRCVRD